MRDTIIVRSPRRRWIFALCLPGLLIAGGWLAASAPPVQAPREAQAPAKPPPRKPVREEEEEPAQPRPKVPLRVGDDDPDPRPREKPAADEPIDLAAAATEAKNPAVRDLFVALKQPHDLIAHKTGLLRVQPLEKYLDPRASFQGLRRLCPFDANWKPKQAFLTESKDVTRYEPYEQLAVNRVDQFLKSGLEREPAGSVRRLDRLDMLVPAETALAAVVNWHKSAWELGVRAGPGWDDVLKTLQARLLAVQVEQLSALANRGDWVGAFELAERLKKAYARQPELQLEYVKLHIQNVTQTLRGGKDSDYITARQGLERLEREILDPRSRDAGEVRQGLDNIRERLRNRAQSLWNQGNALTATDKARAISLLQTAEAIWPQLPGLQDARLKMNNAFPILYVGGRHLPSRLSPATAVTDADRQALELLFESLVKPVYDPMLGQRYEPGLAAGRPRLVPLGRQFQLAPGARWSTGELVTAADVHGTVQLLKDPNWIGHTPEWAALVEGARVEVEDPFRVDLSLRRGYLDPLALMTFKVLPANQLRRIDDGNFARQPVGSGPFQYQGIRRDNQRACALFQANPHYSRRPGKENRPWIREVRFFRSEEPVLEFRSGRLHLLLDLHAEQIKQLESPEAGLKNVRILKLPSRRVTFLAVNHRRPELQNTDLRKAISYALDRDRLLDDSFRAGHKDLHRWLNGPFPRGSWACQPELDRDDRDSPDYPFKPDRARSLANKLGLAGKKLSLTLSYPDDDPRVARACAYIQRQLEDIGLELELKALDPLQLRTAVEGTHDYDLAYYHWDYDNEAYWLWPLFDPQGIDAGGRNFLGYKDDDVLQSRFRQAMSHRQFKEVQATFREIHKELVARMPLIPLWQLDTLIAIQGDLKTVPAPQQLDPLRMFTDVEQWRLGR